MNTLLEIPFDTAASAPTQGQTNSSCRILVVEDDMLARQISVRTLLGFGYHVDTAEDGAGGWEALQAKNYDLLLTDQNMPDMSGVELVRRVRTAQMTLPVILASGGLPMEELEWHRWLKIAAMLSKPFSSEQLLAKVKEALCVPDDAPNCAGASVAIPSANGRQNHVASTLGPQ